jgi:PiT family inorganic phosphate transporter
VSAGKVAPIQKVKAGVGLARGLPTLNLGIVKEIIMSWLATVPFTALLAAILFKIMLWTLG